MRADAQLELGGARERVEVALVDPVAVELLDGDALAAPLGSAHRAERAVAERLVARAEVGEVDARLQDLVDSSGEPSAVSSAARLRRVGGERAEVGGGAQLAGEPHQLEHVPALLALEDVGDADAERERGDQQQPVLHRGERAVGGGGGGRRADEDRDDVGGDDADAAERPPRREGGEEDHVRAEHQRERRS